MTDYLLDTSAWIEFFEGSNAGAEVNRLLQEENVGTSVLTLAEAGTFLSKQYLNYVESHASLHAISPQTARTAGQFRNERRKLRSAFSILDAIFYLTAQEPGAILVTKDTDFNGLPDVQLLT